MPTDRHFILGLLLKFCVSLHFTCDVLGANRSQHHAQLIGERIKSSRDLTLTSLCSKKKEHISVFSPYCLPPV